MDITYLGHSCFKIRGKSGVVVTDPFEDSNGIKMPKVSADVVTSSHDHSDHNFVGAVGGTSTREKPFVINAPGEYEIQGISVFGFSSYHDDKKGQERGKNTIYTIHVDDIVIAHLGDLGHELSQRQVDQINGVDVLLVPVGGVYTIDPQVALKVIEQVEPIYVIPMHYKVSGMSKEFAELKTVDDFVKEAGVESKAQDKLSLQKSTLPEDREIVVLNS